MIAESSIYNQFGRHVLSLVWVDDLKPGVVSLSQPSPMAISGFVISVRGVWFLVTAGHVIDDLEKRFVHSHDLREMFIHDGFGTTIELPQSGFDWRGANKGAIFDKEAGVDFGFIVLRPMYRKLLKKAGVVALEEHMWKRPPSDMHGYLLWGVPNQLFSGRVISTTSGDLLTYSLHAPLVAISRTDDPPKHMQKPIARLYATVPDSIRNEQGNLVKLGDIDGMSGGPIFGLRREGGGTRYWVVGLQSHWDLPTRTIAANFVGPLGRTLGDYLDDNGISDYESE